MTLEELLALWNDEATRAEMTDEQLDELLVALQSHARELLEGERTDEVLAELADLATTVEAIETIQQERTNAAAERDAQADEIATRIFGEAEGEGEGEPAEGEQPEEAETPAEAEAAETPAVETPAEPEAEATPEAEPIAANAAAFTPRVTRVAARRPEASRPRTPAQPSVLVASANVGGDVDAGTPLDDPELLSAAFISAYRRSDGYIGPRSRISVAKAGGDPLDLYGEERFLDSNSRGNSRKIEAITSPRAIIASGGACIAPPINYDQPALVGSEARPMRDGGTVRFGADRAGITTYPPPVLTDLNGAISDWTMKNDEDPSSDGASTKPCLTITCPIEETDSVDAIVRCIKIGNFRSRFFGEQVQAWLDLAAVNQARHAERKLIKAIGDGSTQITSGTLLGTTRDVLATLDRAVAAMESRHRFESLPLRWAAPDWLHDMIRTDIARQMPVGTLDETLALADAQIERWLAIRNVNVTWLLDGETGQQFGAQADGPLIGWPSTVVTYLYPEGSWLFLDGGMFDFGIVRDSTLNSTNDFQVFAETLEGSHFHGVESQRIAMDVCPDGSASALVDINPCATGS